MVSKGKLHPAKWAIDSFLKQTYDQKELIIVVDDPGSKVIRHVQALRANNIRLYVLDGPRRPLGVLRNISVALANGPVVCQWDDDDLYHPERLAVSFRALTESQREAVLLSRWTVWIPDSEILVRSYERPWEGSMMAHKRALPPYPALSMHEDKQLVDQMMLAKSVALFEHEHLYVYVYHGDNSFPRPHFVAIANASDAYSDYRGTLAELATFAPISEYENFIRRKTSGYFFSTW